MVLSVFTNRKCPVPGTLSHNFCQAVRRQHSFQLVNCKPELVVLEQRKFLSCQPYDAETAADQVFMAIEKTTILRQAPIIQSTFLWSQMQTA